MSYTYKYSMCVKSKMNVQLNSVQPLNETIPWVEKYRPTQFEDIVLDAYNRRMFENMLDRNKFPNLLLYGPPGTGKTTTIINIIQEYQRRHKMNKFGSVIHLNASDERGIDIVRNQMYQFVQSVSLFQNDCKFVILDEVDHMTKNAQHALKYLMQTCTQNVRFCLICNYISKTDESLQNEFICVRFNQLPQTDIHKFLMTIAEKENVKIDYDDVRTIQEQFDSDIRSMINYLQINQNTEIWKQKIMTGEMWEEVHAMFLSGDTKLDDGEDSLSSLLHAKSIQYNMDKKQMLLMYFNYLIRFKGEFVTSEMLDRMEEIVHATNTTFSTAIKYFYYGIH